MIFRHLRTIVFLLLATRTVLAADFDPIDYWKRIPHGANVFSGNPATDFEALRNFGGRLVRFGATGSPADFTFLIKGSGESEAFDLRQENLQKIKALFELLQSKGMYGVITLADIPGRRWEFRKRDCRIWASDRFQKEFIEAWKSIAKTLMGIKSVVGFDLMNEPYLPGPKTCKGNQGSLKDLRLLYKRTISAIRSLDTRTPIILESPAMGAADTIDALPVLPEDDRIIYSFHYYEPYAYYSTPENQGKLAYPGKIPNDDGTFTYWDISQHRAILKPVMEWQRQNSISTYRIYVGEFGVWREAPGAIQYLIDVKQLFNEQGWPWSYYSFREDSWANTDLEKIGADPIRQQSELFRVIQLQFK